MKLRELFHCSFYYVAYRQRTSDGLKSDGVWTVIRSSEKEWFADPFLFEWEGRHFIFAERMNRWRLLGSIAVCEIFDNGKASKFKEILVEPFHLSYPNVFEYNGQIFMMPESGNNLDIRLYRAKRFPYEWEFVKVLYSGANFVDTSFVSKTDDGKAVINSYDWDNRKPYYFRFDLNDLSLMELPDNPALMNERCGGNCFEEQEHYYRVLQDCSQRYGKKLLINRIDCDDFEGGAASDQPYMEIQPQDLRLNTKQQPMCCHTYNRAGSLEVIDFIAERFIWFGPFNSIRNKIFFEKHKANNS